MTIQELIAELQRYPAHLPVRVKVFLAGSGRTADRGEADGVTFQGDHVDIEAVRR